MELNNWESRSVAFLTKAFDDDAIDIIRSLEDINPTRIMEIGFGNNRLLPYILNNFYPGIDYYGFDKTTTFISRARLQFKLPGVSFSGLDISRSKHLESKITKHNPDVLILRYILEHVPDWKRVVSELNEYKIPSILISIYTPEPRYTSWSMKEIDKENDLSYTINFIHGGQLNEILNNYNLVKDTNYKDVPHRFKHFKLVEEEDEKGPTYATDPVGTM